MTRHTLTLITLGMLPVLASGCGSGGSAGGGVSEPGRSLRTTLKANSQAACGAATTFTYTITNTGSSATVLGGSNAAVFDVEVDDGGKRVWDYGLANVAGAAQITLAPGQTQTFTISWYSEDAQGVGLKPGTYKVKATLVPQTINGAAASPSQLTALPTATTSTTVSAACDAVFVPNVVLFGVTTAAATLPADMFSALGPVTSFYPEVHDGAITIKSGVSVEAAIAYLQANASIRFAEPNGFGHGA